MGVLNFHYWDGYRFSETSFTEASGTFETPSVNTFKADVILLTVQGDRCSITPYFRDASWESITNSQIGRVNSTGDVTILVYRFPSTSRPITVPISSLLSMESVMFHVEFTGSTVNMWVKPDFTNA